ncbi:hypothetical protein MCUN1_001194 [Malassezia cuniculi]|uniref:Adenylate kinase active site lid domain-containing protein n=1 Tax=Malassezia cuniculi TaxID=948313 RepID=A0AAF0ESE6_9BASI|nr:hypothetical protein MCUN1_001194 [Malassezia cuniculi]
MLILGCPGSGKGTLSARVEKHFGIPIINAGDVLRWHIAHETDIGRQARDVIHNGQLMPDSIMMQLIGEKAISMGDHDWLLDGFPRTAGQADMLLQALHEQHTPLTLVVNLRVPESIILQRILERWTHIPSGRVYNLSYNPPQRPGLDDVTGEPLEKRDDDNPDTFKLRIDSFHAKTEPMIERLRSERCVYDPSRPLLVDLAGETSNAIWPKLRAAIEERCPHLVK